MRIYNHYSYGRGTIFVSPGAHHPETAEWIDPQTKAPLMFTVKFEDGMAEVPDNLGRYIIAQQLAQTTPVILPARLAQEQAAEIERLTRENEKLRAKLGKAA